jgi:hypothetical protein
MSEVQQLRDQLEELGFTVLNDANEQNATFGVLPVEAWVRYTPYALIPVPMRGDSETERSYTTRIHIADESVEALYAQAAGRDSEFSIPSFDIEPEPTPEPAYEETPEPDYDSVIYDDEQPAVIVVPDYITDPDDDNDYYAYIPPVVEPEPQPEPEPEPIEEPVVEEAPTPVEPEKSETNDSTEYAEVDRAKLVELRSQVQSFIDTLDEILGK